MALEKVKEIIKTQPDFTRHTELAAERLGGKVLFATDDFFCRKGKPHQAGEGHFHS